MAAIGLDIGTTSVKLCVIDSQGNILATDKREHEQERILTPGIQDGQKIIELALEMLTDPSRRWLKITDIYIAGQMHGVVLWNDRDIVNGKLGMSTRMATTSLEGLLSPFHSWSYQNEAGILEEIHSYKSEGTRVHEGFGSATLVELMKNNYNQRYNRCGTIMDLLACILTKSEQVRMSEQLAESWGLTLRSDEKLKWDEPFKERMEKLINLPTIVQSPASLGKCVLKDLENINVHLPLGDLQSSVCSIAGQPNHHFASDTAYIIVGTSAQLCTVQTKEICDSIDLSSFPTILQLSFTKDYKFLAACSRNGGNALVNTVRLFTQYSDPTQSLKKIFEEMHDAVANNLVDKNVKATSVRFLPERNHAGEAGLAISGVQRDTKLNDILAAVCVGLVENLFALFPCEVFEMLSIKRIVLIGEANGSALSIPISEKVADHGVQVQNTHAKMNAALGAILLNL